MKLFTRPSSFTCSFGTNVSSLPLPRGIENNATIMSNHDISPAEISSIMEESISGLVSGNKSRSLPRIVATQEETKKEERESEVATPLKDVDIATYKRRFWILGIFSYTFMVNQIIWMSFGPILESAKYAFGWSNGLVSLMTAWNAISSLLFTFPLNRATQKHGLRKGMIFSSGLIAVSAGLRCISLNDSAFLYLASVTAILNGMGSALTMTLPAMLSATWFPHHERATATAVGTLSFQLATAAASLGPLVVRSPDGVLTKDEAKNDIFQLMCIHFGMAALGFACTLVYCPEKPPKPASLSSSVERTDFNESVKILLRSPKLMFVITTNALARAISGSWLCLMNLSLNCYGISQDQTMWIAITSCIASLIVTIVAARVTDCLFDHMKTIIIVLLGGASTSFFWFLLMTEKIVLFSYVHVFGAIVCAISMQYASLPLSIEMISELAYPCPESVVGTLLIFTVEVFDAGFCLLPLIPSECFRWISFFLVASCSLQIIPMIVIKGEYTRSNIDRGIIKLHERDESYKEIDSR